MRKPYYRCSPSVIQPEKPSQPPPVVAKKKEQPLPQKCKACSQAISGCIYECVQCEYRLCGACEQAGAHREHYVLRVPAHSSKEELKRVLFYIHTALSHVKFERPLAAGKDSDDDSDSADDEPPREPPNELPSEPPNEPPSEPPNEPPIEPETVVIKMELADEIPLGDVPAPTVKTEPVEESFEGQEPATGQDVGSEPASIYGCMPRLNIPVVQEPSASEPSVIDSNTYSETYGQMPGQNTPVFQVLNSGEPALGDTVMYSQVQVAQITVRSAAPAEEPSVLFVALPAPDGPAPPKRAAAAGLQGLPKRSKDQDYDDPLLPRVELGSEAVSDDRRSPAEIISRRDRSRSPLRAGRSPTGEIRTSPTRSPSSQITPHGYTSGDLVFCLYDEDGNMLDPVDEDFLVVPNDHFLFEAGEVQQPAEQSGAMGDSPRRSRGPRVRGGRSRRVRGSRGAVGYNQGALRCSRGAASGRWQSGDPLREMHSDDIPADLIATVRTSPPLQESTAAERTSLEEDSEEEDAEATDTFFADYTQFEWSSMDSFLPTEEPFVPEHTGSTESYSSPYSAFRSYWDDGILGHIVRETNAYASKISSPSFHLEWVPTNKHEILVLFSFWMMLGIIRMPTLKSCFSSTSLLQTTVFRRLFTRKRYDALVRALHFADTDPGDETRHADPLKRIRPILTHLNSRFQANYTPSKNICIDESLILWKGKLNIRQYIRTKSAKFGIKTFELCESGTGYLWSFFVYTGKQTIIETGKYSGLQKSTATVLTLIEPLLNKGYRLFMDNWFNSPLLARYLKCNGTDCVGTLRPNRQMVPPIINHCKLKQGQIFGIHSGDVCIMAWRDKKKVTTISTCHGLSQGLPTVSSTSSKDLFKPQVVLDYNKYMGGVDLKDQMLEPYLLERKRCVKWYMKLFKRLLNCSVLNSRILFESSTKRRHDHLEFRLRLVEEIVSNHLSRCPASRKLRNSRNSFPSSSRIPEPSSHWPIRVPNTDRDAEIGRQSRKHCFMCRREGRKYQKSAYQCEQCNVPLCIEACFKSYHLFNNSNASAIKKE